jgi:hypothetical protein
MIRRLRYPIFIIVALVIIHFAIQPYLYQLFRSNTILEVEYRLYYFSFNLLVTIVIAIIIYFEGKYTGFVQAVSGLLVLNALLDLIRLNAYPDVSIVSCIITMFSGILIFGFSLVSVKKAIFKKGAGVVLLILGGVYMLRFPIFIDVLYFYFKKYPSNLSPADGYYFGTLYANYFIIFLELVALDSLILENIAMSRYTKPN